MTDNAIVEVLARGIDPDAWHPKLREDGLGVWWHDRRTKALARAATVIPALREAGYVVQQGWRLIEDGAPKDGTCILVWLPQPHRQSHVHSMKTGNGATIGSHFDFDVGSPTHWMPLPGLPEDTQ